jgi:hypothetical protein
VACCGSSWIEDEEWVVAETKLRIKKIGGPKIVDMPGGGKGFLKKGEEVELPRQLARALVDGGEFEVVDDAPKKEPAEKPAEKES